MSSTTVVLYDSSGDPVDTIDSPSTLLSAADPTTPGDGLANSFSTPDESGLTLLSISLGLYATDPTDGGSFTIDLIADNGGVPSTTVLATLATVADSTLTSDTDGTLYSFTPPDVTLAPETRYWIALTTSDSASVAWTYSTADGGTGVGSEFFATGTDAVSANNADGASIMVVDAAAACYAAGTCIATPAGGMPIESLSPGDLVRTLSGVARPVIWVGRRAVDCARHPRPDMVCPVRIRANALADGVPARDLLVSPEHSLLINGLLIPARALVNGANVVREQVEHITWWHVELASHDVILAEGMPAETYVDTGNRAAFENAGTCVQLHPDFGRAMHAAQACAPFADTGPAVDRARARLHARACAQGFVAVDGPWWIAADGARLAAESDGIWTVPAGTQEVLLGCAPWRPMDIEAGSTDSRELGLCVGAIALDGATLALDDPRLGGFHAPERDGAVMWRWTDGAGILPAELWPADAPTHLRIDVTVPPRAWRAPEMMAASAA